MGRIKKQPPRPSLFQLTGEKYPHPGRKWPNTDIRLKVYLNNLAEAMKSPELDQVIWVLCAGCYWLTHEQAIEVGGLLDRLLREDYL